MEDSSRYKTILGTLMVICLMVGGIVAFAFNQQVFVLNNEDVDGVEVVVVEKQGIWLPITGDHDFADPDASGFCYGMAYPHQADPATAYASNLSNATAYEFSDDLDAEMTGETPYDTTFDLVAKYRINDTLAWDVVNESWREDWIRAYVDADFSSATDFNNVAVTVVNISANDNFIWVHIYIQDIDGGTGDGFQITHNEDYTWFPLLEVYY